MADAPVYQHHDCDTAIQADNLAGACPGCGGPEPDPVAAYLAEARQAAATGPIADGRRLVAALEVVLAKAQEWAAVWPPDGHWEPTDSVLADAGRELIEAISAALLGEGEKR